MATGYIEIDKETGQRIATGKGGCQGWLEWLYVNEPKTAAALLARVMPYFIDTMDEMPVVMSRSEVEASFREFGLPLDLIEHLQKAPAPLDPGESDDPYGLKKDVTSQGDVTSDAAKALGPVKLLARQQSNILSIDACLHAIAVVFDLVDPFRAAGRRVAQ